MLDLLANATYIPSNKHIYMNINTLLGECTVQAIIIKLSSHGHIYVF